MTRAKSGISPIGTTLTFLKVGTCSETLCKVLDRAFDHPLELEERAALPLAGGIMQQGYQCGAIWGAALAAGAQAYRLLGAGPQAEAQAIVAAQRIVDSFRARNHNTDCRALTDTDWRNSKQALRYFFKGGAIRCFSMVAQYAPIAFREINIALAEKPVAVFSFPVSCAAMLAHKMGVSDMHAVMAAGLAGGIGLSGGACGALGAAIWIIGMKSSPERVGKIDFKNPRAIEAIDRFVICTGSKFECSEIVGRRFESVGDHADYLRAGGCAEIIEVLAGV